MPSDSAVTKRQRADGSTEEVLSFTFSNGAKAQLEDLKEYFKQESELEVLRLGLSFLQQVKESETKGAQDASPES